jgi:hypothetical protein
MPIGECARLLWPFLKNNIPSLPIKTAASMRLHIGKEITDYSEMNDKRSEHQFSTAVDRYS